MSNINNKTSNYNMYNTADLAVGNGKRNNVQ
jgi:hypothetical protein